MQVISKRGALYQRREAIPMRRWAALTIVKKLDHALLFARRLEIDHARHERVGMGVYGIEMPLAINVGPNVPVIKVQARRISRRNGIAQAHDVIEQPAEFGVHVDFVIALPAPVIGFLHAVATFFQGINFIQHKLAMGLPIRRRSCEIVLPQWTIKKFGFLHNRSH